MERKLLNRVLDLNDDLKDNRTLEVMREKLYMVDVPNLYIIFSGEEDGEKADKCLAEILVEANKALDHLEIKDEKREEVFKNMSMTFSAMNRADINARKKMEEALEKRLKDTEKVYLNPFEFLRDEDGIEDTLDAIEKLLEASIAARKASTEEIQKLGEIKLKTLKTACNALSNIKEQLKEKVKEEEEEEERMEKANQEGFKILSPEEINDNNYLNPIEIEEKADLQVEKVLFDNYFIKVEYLQDTHDLTTFPADTLSIPLIRIEGKNMAISPCTIEYIPFIHAFRVNFDRPDWPEDDIVNVFRCGYDQMSASVEITKYIENRYSFIINLKTKDSNNNNDIIEEVLKKINLVLVNLRLFKFYDSKDTVRPKLPRINGFDPYCVKLIKDISKLDIDARNDEKGNYRLSYGRPFIITPDTYSDHLYKYSHNNIDTSKRYCRDYPESTSTYLVTDTIDWTSIGENDFMLFKRTRGNDVSLFRELPLPVYSEISVPPRITNRDLMIYTYLESLICDSDYYQFMLLHKVFKQVFEIEGLTIAKKNKEAGNAIMFFKNECEPFLEIEKINLETSNGESSIVYKGRCKNEDAPNEYYFYFYANNSDELSCALRHCYEGSTKQDSEERQTAIKIISEYIDSVLYDEEAFVRNYSLRRTLNCLPETEEEYYEDEEGNFDEADSYEYAIEYNLSKEIKSFNGYQFVSRFEYTLPMRYTLSTELKNDTKVIKVSVYPIENSHCFEISDSVKSSSYQNPLYFQATISKGEDGIIVSPLYESFSSYYRYYSRGLHEGDYETRNKMLEELCEPFKSGVLHELVKSYFDIIDNK
jgi:hypothetical protein